MTNNLSGPEELTRTLGKDRVMTGFVFAGGKREGDVVRAMSGIGRSRISSPFGEIDGRITPRLKRLIGILRNAGLSAKTSTAITNFLATHAALVAPVAALIIKHGCDTYALARSKADLRLLVDALREALAVLRATGFKIVPTGTSFIKIIPRFVLVTAMRLFLSTKFAEVGAGWHCSQAPDEMRHLALELQALVDQASLPVPALRKVLGQ